MTYSEALEYLTGIPRFSKTVSLERIRFLLSALGNPQNDLKFVHIAGTNGKGSITTMLSRILISAGLKTGTYISPFVEDFRERICVNGEFIEKETLINLAERVAAISKGMEDFPNAFEQITAIALTYFKECGCDIVCLEAGLGGKWDATNIIPPPLISVIASIGLDHMQFLGDTHEKIAIEKCGIIKSGSQTVVSPLQPNGIISLILENCKEKNVPAVVPDTDKLTIYDISLSGSKISYESEEYHISMYGRHQISNALTAMEAAKLLQKAGYPITQKNISSGIKSTALPARAEVISTQPLCIVDGAHNSPGIDALCSLIDELLKEKKIITVFGCLEDKSVRTMVEKVAGKSHSFFCVLPESPKACSLEALKEFATPFCHDVRAYTSLDQATKDALALCDADCAVLACGSLYLAGPAKLAIKRLLN